VSKILLDQRNAENVLQRYKKLEDKKSQLKISTQKREEEREELERKLEKLREVVRSRVSAERNPERLLQSTASFSQSFKALEEVNGNEKLFQVHGYTDREIMHDQRAKLLHLLSTSGNSLSAESRSYMINVMGSLKGVKNHANDWKSTLRLGE